MVNYLDNYHSAFKATLDGKPVKIYRTYGTFKGILVPKGKHRVAIRCDPLSFRIALTLFWISGATLLVLALREIIL